MSSNKGIRVGEVLTNFHGILTGVPTFVEGSDIHFDDEGE
jgi:circadian clock protein KaiC